MIVLPGSIFVIDGCCILRSGSVRMIFKMYEVCKIV